MATARRSDNLDDMARGETPDYYEILQISPTAEPVWGNDSGIPVSEKLIGMCKEAKG